MVCVRLSMYYYTHIYKYNYIHLYTYISIVLYLCGEGCMLGGRSSGLRVGEVSGVGVPLLIGLPMAAPP